jgi:serine/threonine-protein kinase HipA
VAARVEVAEVRLWGEQAGAVAWLENQQYAVFEYAPAFLATGLDISPLHMSVAEARRTDGQFSFPALDRKTYLGLPGLLADSLPDKYGNVLIDAWLARQGRDPAGFSPIERLCYTGTRGMGALEFKPGLAPRAERSVPVEVARLVALAQDVLKERKGLAVSLSGAEYESTEALGDILRVGTSAGGARAKAVIAMNENGDVRSGQVAAPPEYDYWILKFDGVEDLELGQPEEYGRVEYAYYHMAREAGIAMTECRLLEENGRAHFLTRRFDRPGNDKLHLQTLCGIAHFDFNQAGAYGYEQAFQVMRQLRLSKADALEQFRRMVFNVVARNLDDHTKNISFLMDKRGKWHLSPAYDVTYAHNPAGLWTNRHQMTINGKRQNISRDDLITVAKSIGLRRPEEVIESVVAAVADWPRFAREAGVSTEGTRKRAKQMQLSLDL